MILSFINIFKVPWESLKTSGFALGFQHFPQDLANVNEWKIMFDPSIERILMTTCSLGLNGEMSKIIPLLS